MNKLLISSALLCVLYLGYANAKEGVDCTTKSDGAYGWGCKAFTRCRGGRGRQIFCDGTTVFNPETEDCDDPANVAPPCGLVKDCTLLPDGRYADEQVGCTSYFTCRDGAFWGHHACAPGLVFDNEDEVCDWIANVPPPCGTYDGDDDDWWNK